MEWRNQDKTWKLIDKLKHMVGKTVAVFDTETVGLKSDAKIIQFSGAKYFIRDNGLEQIQDFDIYLNPEERLSEKITEITGITDSMLQDCPTEREMAFSILSFLDADIICGYNVPFDIKKVEAMAVRCGFYWTEYEYTVVDLLPVVRDLFQKEDVGDHKLSSVVNYLFPLNEIRFHSALEDVQATSMILEYVLYKATKADVEQKEEFRLEHAFFNINPRKASQKRIKLILNVGEMGDIYWDCVLKTWSCKKTKSAAAIFEKIDMNSIERQLYRKYAWLYGYPNDMETLAKNWEKAYREKQKQNG